jgi:hypothetical protein
MTLLFDKQHYEAFDQPKPTFNDASTITERIRVREAFLQLHEMIWPFITSSNWDLHCHRQKAHYVSSDHFIFLDDGTPIVKYIDGMWLHYGKSPEQLDFLKTIGGFDYSKRDFEDYYNAFYLHTRIQFYINSDVFRAWLLIATDKNYYDRSEFLRKLYRDPTYRNTFYHHVQNLFDQGYFYEIDNEKLPLVTGMTDEQLFRFVKKDHAGAYSGIVKEYQPNDPLLDVENIRDEMIRNLELLYPIYDFVAWRP